VNPILAEIPPLPPPQPAAPRSEPKPAPPPKPKVIPVEVSDPNELKDANSVLVLNLPFKQPGANFVPVLAERFGDVVKFSQTSGKLVAEFSDRNIRNTALHAIQTEWNGRTPRLRAMTKPFTWDPPKRP
jgi:hypothetical protein